MSGLDGLVTVGRASTVPPFLQVAERLDGASRRCFDPSLPAR